MLRSPKGIMDRKLKWSRPQVPSVFAAMEIMLTGCLSYEILPTSGSETSGTNVSETGIADASAAMEPATSVLEASTSASNAGSTTMELLDSSTSTSFTDEGVTTLGEDTTTPATTCPTTEDLVCIAAGSFVDVNTVSHDIATFLLDRQEVTARQYTTCVAASICDEPTGTTNADNGDYNYGGADRSEHPINGVSWLDANTYCEWAGGRLPTEWEWEWAARGGEAARTYPWGHEPEPTCDFAVMFDEQIGCDGTVTNSVGSKSPNGDSVDGIQDMSGNVLEWTDSYYDSSQVTRVLRGGNGGSLNAESFRVDYRIGIDPLSRAVGSGFRCARSTDDVASD